MHVLITSDGHRGLVGVQKVRTWETKAENQMLYLENLVVFIGLVLCVVYVVVRASG